MSAYPWEPGTATGVGSMPGTDPAEALRVVLGEASALPYLPELPARGVGADMIGRTAGLLVDLPVRVEPSGWRVADAPGRDLRRAHDHLARDLDLVEEVANGHDGPFKVQVTGPWTLAASIETNNGQRMLRDPGAVRDLAASLTEGIAAHVADVRRRLPRATVLLQVDEPRLPAVLAGRVPTASGLSRVRAVEEPVAQETLHHLVEAVGAFAVAHCCSGGVPYALLRDAGFRALSVDLARHHRRDDDVVGETIEAGTALLVGAVPGIDGASAQPPALGATIAPVRDLWRRLGFPPERLGPQVVVTPACGLAGASPQYARAALVRCRDAARALHEAADA